MTMCTDRDPKTRLRLEEPIACGRCGQPLKSYLADYHRLAHVRCLLKAVNGWAPPQGRPHYVW
jgi:hypothetical protein